MIYRHPLDIIFLTVAYTQFLFGFNKFDLSFLTTEYSYFKKGPIPGSHRVLKITFSLTFSYEDGLTTEKHTKKTSVCG